MWHVILFRRNGTQASDAYEPTRAYRAAVVSNVKVFFTQKERGKLRYLIISNGYLTSLMHPHAYCIKINKRKAI